MEDATTRRGSETGATGAAGPPARDDDDGAAAWLLWRIVAEMGDAGTYADVLSRICRTFAAAVPCDRVTIYVRSRRRDAFVAAADYGSPPEVARTFVGRAFGPGSFPGEEIVRAGGIVFGERGSGPSAVDSVLDDARLYSIAIVPIVLGDEIEGVITCGCDGPPGFRAEQMQVVRRVAGHVGLVMRNARLETKATRLLERRTRLASWTAEVMAAGEVGTMAGRLAAACCDLFASTNARLLLVEDDALAPVATPADGPDFAQMRIPLESPAVTATALRERRVLAVNQYRGSSYHWGGPTIEKPSSVMAAPLVDDQGPLGVLIVYDVHDPFRFGANEEEDAGLLATMATAALRKGLLVQALTRANATKDEFLSNVSHDLRTPLNVIVGYAQLMAEGVFGTPTAEQEDVLARLLRTATEQVHLIDDLLDLARIEQGKLRCLREPVPVADLVPSLRDMMDALLRGRPVAFDVDVPPDVVAHTDRERLRQILVNVLGNAAKFTREGTVRLAARRQDAMACIDVTDTGPGIDPDLRATVIEPFVRGATEGAGTGLGLAIVARLLRVLDGRLTIGSRPGAGTNLRIELPTH